MVEAQVMERHLSDEVTSVKVAQKRKGCLQECFGCEAKTRFDFYKGGEKDKFATAKEDSSFCCRFFCAPNHSFTMSVLEQGTEAEILSVDRPFKCCATCFSCCCFQSMAMSSGGKDIGKINEKCYCCVPRFDIVDSKNEHIYKLHQPTCIGGMCVNCCAEGNPCGRACCKVPFHVFPADQEDTDNGAEAVGKILKVKKSLGAEIFTDADVFEVDFPADADAEKKGLLVGSAIFLNAIFFENRNGEDQ